MARRRRGRPVHGWVVVDKPSGATSVQCVAAVRRAADAAKAGHAGTLDPLATGLLPVALGEATKTVAHVMDGRKVYRFRVRWGERRDTDDAEGRVAATSDRRPSAAEIAAVLPRFVGVIDQVPPAFSAIKVDGRRAYALARGDGAPQLAARPITILRLDVIDAASPDSAEFEAACGKGAYMRALARDLALALGTEGYVEMLRRIAVGPFTEDHAIPLDNVRELGHSDGLAEHVLPVEASLADIPALTLTEPEARRLQNGQPVAALPVARRSPEGLPSRAGVFCAMSAGRPVALARITGGEIRPLRVLNL